MTTTVDTDIPYFTSHGGGERAWATEPFVLPEGEPDDHLLGETDCVSYGMCDELYSDLRAAAGGDAEAEQAISALAVGWNATNPKRIDRLFRWLHENPAVLAILAALPEALAVKVGIRLAPMLDRLAAKAMVKRLGGPTTDYETDHPKEDAMSDPNASLHEQLNDLTVAMDLAEREGNTLKRDRLADKRSAIARRIAGNAPVAGTSEASVARQRPQRSSY